MGKKNTEILELETGGHIIKFVCDARATGNGFAHYATMFVDGIECNKGSAHYLNRTWEAWRYQSVCLQRCSEVIDSRSAQLKAEYKRDRGLSSVRGNDKDELQRIIDADPYVVLMRGAKKALDERPVERW